MTTRHRGLGARLGELERAAQDRADHRRAPRPLPLVLPDDTPAAELERLRAAGVEAMRFIEFVEVCVVAGPDAASP